jgi:hypothetical protein
MNQLGHMADATDWWRVIVQQRRRTDVDRVEWIPQVVRDDADCAVSRGNGALGLAKQAILLEREGDAIRERARELDVGDRRVATGRDGENEQAMNASSAAKRNGCG